MDVTGSVDADVRPTFVALDRYSPAATTRIEGSFLTRLPFDGRNFCQPEPFSFDGAALAGARAAALPRQPLPPFLSAPLADQQRDVALADLIAFLVHPVNALLNRRLGVHVPDREESVRRLSAAKRRAPEQPIALVAASPDALLALIPELPE